VVRINSPGMDDRYPKFIAPENRHKSWNKIPVKGAGPDISVGKKILALIATKANKKIRTMRKGATF
jgi:hypothetical protein